MIDVRIVCAHDAVKLAEAITRLLEAEDHRVRLSFGRQALNELEEARGARDAVLLIWSPNARSQTYMIEWARNIDATRLIEIAHGAGDWPPIKRLAAVVDFTNWRGQRGARAWKALTERLGAITRALGPPEYPARALMAAGFAGLAVVTGAVGARLVAAPVAAPPTPITFEEIAVIDPDEGMGGSLNVIEPASIEEQIQVRRFREIQLIEPLPAEPLAALPHYEEYELRNRTLLEQLNAYVRRRGDDSTE